MDKCDLGKQAKGASESSPQAAVLVSAVEPPWAPAAAAAALAAPEASYLYENIQLPCWLPGCYRRAALIEWNMQHKQPSEQLYMQTQTCYKTLLMILLMWACETLRR